jgi:hypothetical protein
VEKPKFPVAVVMQRRELDNRWQSEAWEPRSVIPSVEPKGEPRLLVDEGGLQQWLFPGLELVLHRDEAEGYYVNVSARDPRVMVCWRMDGLRGVPLDVTVSYDEGGRWLDAGNSVDAVAMPLEIFAWVGEYVEKNYRPEPKKRIKPRSFVPPKDRVG